MLVFLAGCGGGDGAAEASSTDLPEWLTKIYPAPGANTTATRAVQVGYTVMPRREVRLVIDGTDVTTYARTGPGLLEYDADQAASPLELEPGSHEATVELYQQSVISSESGEEFRASERELIDSFSWKFTVS